ncbi:MAG: hypothetical protein AAB288_11350 [Acidobacteriota bacterium]
MKFHAWYLIVVGLLTTACEPGLSSFDKDVGSVIKKQCTFEGRCKIKLREVTKFDWDEMYVLRPGVLDVEARKYLPEVGELNGEFNRKIVFFKNGKRVEADEAPSIIEAEHTPPGMLFFDDDAPGNPDCLRCSANAVVEVRQEKWIR